MLKMPKLSAKKAQVGGVSRRIQRGNGMFFFSRTALDFESGRGEGCSLPYMNLTAGLEYIHTTGKLECATSRDDSDSMGGNLALLLTSQAYNCRNRKKSLRLNSRWSVLES